MSSVGQNTDRQEILMEEMGVEKVYLEKASGKNAKDRPVLNEMMGFLREGDILVVQSISRFARNTKDLLNLVDELDKKGVEFVSLKEDIDTSNTVGRFVLTVFAAISELELNYIKENQRQGIEAAKLRGVYKGRKKIDINKKQFETIYDDWKQGKIRAVQAMKILGLKPNTFYRRVQEFECRLTKECLHKKSLGDDME